eukprot:CAMPEP_0194273046 /NCGR_PEP_ID=MMETSP0169-20130528/6456_1 /TAXON_ID=218684 /ORGANISM="Corethron pennatum, Strain L29A3" /LENGTH=1122 /DNA_ID=CAMNT_0039015869 /DNA_START=71 /DNA_END=3436 /DNA_ORIENTATION=-
MRIVLLLVVSLALTGAEDRVDRLVEWFRDRGGIISEKLDIRRTDPSDPHSPMGIFATEKLHAEETLLELPRGADGVVLESADVEEMSCATVRRIVRETALGAASAYAPYLRYLAGEPRGAIPSAWSDDGRALLTGLLRHGARRGPSLPPQEADAWLDHEWVVECDGGRSRAEWEAAELVVSRGWDGIMLPVYDIMRHRNGPSYNTAYANMHDDGEPVRVRTTQSVEAGTELFMSVNMCEHCEDMLESFGTAEVFRDYGFVEELPQRWFFEEQELGFEVDENREVSWIYDPPTAAGSFLRDARVALEAAAGTIAERATHDTVPDGEFAKIKEYHEALYQAVLLAATKVSEDEVTCSMSGEEQTCTVLPNRYVDLTRDTAEIDLSEDWDEDEIEFCDQETIMDFDGYKDVEDKRSMYQRINTFYNNETKDTCFILEETVQICTNYRPHYHEMVVHHTARHLPEIKRVVWVGGGDSMLLHDILKYPSLEKVVGLELDQDVTRNAFKHFGVQPHWDNPKVEWWYGDAAKSLLMLPKDYFGSFDLVLVDLSETVMSFKVTNKLNIMQALALLLAPHGIMVKNELYFEDMSKIFVHTAQVHYYDTPVICSQALILGSHSTHFLGGELTDHGVDDDLLFVPPLERGAHTALFHDYAHVPANIEQHCMTEENQREEEPAEQTDSPGILLVVEVERSPLARRPLPEIAEVLASVLAAEGLTVLSTVVPPAAFDRMDAVLVVVAAEGYVGVHVWPTRSYCGFDVHLWSGLEGQAGVREALVRAAGGTDASSYRIVAGGMYGTDRWREGDQKKGPRYTLPCDADAAPMPRDADAERAAGSVVLEEALRMFGDPSGRVLVVCGREHAPCESAEVATKKNDSAIILWTCANVASRINDATSLYACEQDILQTLEAVPETSKITAIVLDPTALYGMGQVLFRMLSDRQHPFAAAVAAVALLPGGWQRHFVHRVHKEILANEPAFRGHVVFHGAEGNDAYLSVAATDAQFAHRLLQAAAAVEARTGRVAEITQVAGGQLSYQGRPYEDYTFFRPDQYDAVSPLEQWASQTPLERQTLYQLEADKHSRRPLSAEHIEEALVQALSSSHTLEFPCGVAAVRTFAEAGDGAVLVALWSGG